jgi:glucose/arabinose dehydrogenase
MRVFRWSFVVAVVAFVPSVFAGTPQDVNFAESVYASGLSQITGMTWATDGSSTLFVGQKSGAVRVIRNGTLQAANFAAVTVFTNSECGLDNVIVDPAYASNKFVYVFATVSSSTQQVLRFTATVDGSGNLVGTNRIQIGPNLPCMGVNHDGGGMAIGADGYLYVGIGNLGNGNNVGGDGTATEWTSYGSKILRMDRFSGAPVSTNPWYNDATHTDPKVDYFFAKGFRNPFGLRMRPGTNDLWLTEVGDSWEQIFLVTAGSTQGWPTENNTANSAKLMPKLAYQTNVSTFGGCITRGAFYNGSAFPAQYQNNFFFVDYNSGKVMRSVLDSTLRNINSTSVFVSGNSSLTDVGVGPDGALYYSSHGGTIYRLRYTGSAQQNIVLSSTSLTVNEGSSGTLTVRLAAAPAATVTVGVARSSGNASVSPSPASLSFTTSNWSTPQTVTVSAVNDADTFDNGATITCTSSGLTSQSVVVIARDNDVAAGSPLATITQPKNGATISGATAEFYGDGTPAAGATLSKADFYVDGALMYTDPWDAAEGHFHYGGGHLRFDTTQFGNGTHLLRLTVTQTNGLSRSHEVTVTISNQATSGLKGEYFDAVDFTLPKMTRVDPTVNFDWGSGSPSPSVGADTFSVRWTGQVLPQFSETYTFTTTSDDGVRLWVNNVQIVNNWTNHTPTENNGVIALTAGRRVEIKMEYYENGGGAVAKLMWASPSLPREIIPQSRLSPGASFKQDAGADGIVSIEAESYHGHVDRSGHSWVPTAPAGFSGSGSLLADPNIGANIQTGYAAASPRLDFKINFVKTGVHQVWVRGIGANGSDDSVHVGLDGVETATSDKISSFFTSWTWSRATMDNVAATINVTAPGVHTVNVWMREDGFVFDKLVLTVNANYVPSGTGPAQSPR